jgi:hypothetical protein
MNPKIIDTNKLDQENRIFSSCLSNKETITKIQSNANGIIHI